MQLSKSESNREWVVVWRKLNRVWLWLHAVDGVVGDCVWISFQCRRRRCQLCCGERATTSQGRGFSRWAGADSYAFRKDWVVALWWVPEAVAHQRRAALMLPTRREGRGDLSAIDTSLACTISKAASMWRIESFHGELAICALYEANVFGAVLFILFYFDFFFFPLGARQSLENHRRFLV